MAGARRARLTAKFLQGEQVRAGSKVYDWNDTALTGFLLRVHPTGNRAFYLRYRNAKGRTRMLKLGDANRAEPQQARAKARELLADVALGRDPAAERREASAGSLGAYLSGPYEQHVLTKRRSKRNALADLRRIQRNFPHLLPRGMASITILDIERWRTKRQKSGVAPATINNDVFALKAALNAAVRLGLLSEDPLKNLKPLRNPAAGGRVRYLAADERTRLEQALAKRDRELRTPETSGRYADHILPMYLLSVNTGIRRGELFGLEWRDVELERRSLTIRAETAKSGKGRHVPLNAVALGALEAWRGQADDTGLVFKSPLTAKRFDNIAGAWRGVLAMAEVGDFRWHDLRHEFASCLVMKGVDLNTVRELLGHADLKMTIRYAHLAPEHKAAAVALLDGEGSAE